MKDAAGSIIDYMRISITDRCNLRCKYCMPYGIRCLPKQEILTLEEIQTVVESAAKLGIRRIKITGGEPLTRKDCPQLVRMLKSVPGIENVTITTNGVLLEEHLEALLDAGIDGINISLDTLDRRLYQEITGSNELDNVLRIIRRMAELTIPIKINAVSIDFDDMTERLGITGRTGWQQIVGLAKEYPIDVRFIEMMPIGYGKIFKSINHNKLLEDIRTVYPQMKEDHTCHGFGPAVYYHIPGFQGSIGFISAIHGKFCENCNRVRLTAQGYLKTCLCYKDGADLRSILRAEYDGTGRENQELWKKKDVLKEDVIRQKLTETMREAIWQKPAAHCFERPEEITEAHNMAAIGG